MRIDLKKIGTTLISRPAGREAYLAIQQLLREMNDKKKLKLISMELMY